jgi:hypothetical protein
LGLVSRQKIIRVKGSPSWYSLGHAFYLVPAYIFDEATSDASPPNNCSEKSDAQTTIGAVMIKRQTTSPGFGVNGMIESIPRQTAAARGYPAFFDEKPAF